MNLRFEPSVIHHGLVQSDEGPETGHRYRFTIASCSAVRDAQDPGHVTDAEWWGQLRTVEVRAHSLKDALLKAAELPNQVWFEADGQAPVMPADQLR
jgi:hypothetical protein